MSGSCLSHETVAAAASFHNVLRCLRHLYTPAAYAAGKVCSTKQGKQAWCKDKKKI